MCTAQGLNNDFFFHRKEVIALLQQLWKRMLLRTRYPEASSAGLDGTTYEFATWHVYGETWSPQERKSPLLFVELGESLIGYCEATPAERSAAIKEIENKLIKRHYYF